MGPRELFLVMLVFAAFITVTRWARFRRASAKRVRYDTLEQQLAADFPAHRDEARALLETVLAETKPENREMVWRRLLDGSRGDIARLRKLTPKTVEGLRKLYRLFGDSDDDAPRP